MQKPADGGSLEKKALHFAAAHVFSWEHNLHKFFANKLTRNTVLHKESQTNTVRW
jgi:hypothetical protein